MSGIDQRLEFLGRAIGGIGREGQHAVVAPVARAGKVVQRHQLDGGDAQCGERRQTSLHAGVAAERADVQFVEHGLIPGPAGPVGVLPCIGLRIDHHARVVNVAGLQARGRVGHGGEGGRVRFTVALAIAFARHAVAVARARAAVDLELEPAALVAAHRQGALRITGGHVAGRLDREHHGGAARRPQSKTGVACIVAQLSAEIEAVAVVQGAHRRVLNPVAPAGSRQARRCAWVRAFLRPAHSRQW